MRIGSSVIGARAVGWLLTSASALVAAPLSAQGVPLPTREQIQLPEAPSALPPAQVAVDSARREASCPFASSTLTAQIDRVTFTDPTGAPLPDAIASALAGVTPAAGEKPIAQVCDLRDAATRRLTAAGFIAAVSIPPQEIGKDARSLRLMVIPARFVRIAVDGDAGTFEGQITALTERLRARYPLRTADIERELLLASNPGLDVKMTLVPVVGANPGDVEGRLRVARRPFALNAFVHNWGSKLVGRETGSVRAEFYGLTGLADTTFVGASSTLDFREQWTVQGGHYFAPGPGLSLGGSLAWSEARPDLAGLDLRTHSLLGAVEGSATLARTVTSRATIGAGMEFVDQKSRLFGGGIPVPVTRDKLRVAFLKLQGSRRTLAANGRETGSLGGTLELRRGLDILDATPRSTFVGGYAPSRIEGDPTAWVLRTGYAARAGFGAASLLAEVQGQYAGKPLLAFEEYSVGNFTIGRGYDPAANSGDNAIAARLQPSAFVRIGRATVAEPYAFLDVARIWNEDSVTTERDRTLRSAGLGARFHIAGRFTLDAVWAHPFDRPLNLAGTTRAPDRFLFSLSASLGPQAR